MIQLGWNLSKTIQMPILFGALQLLEKHIKCSAIFTTSKSNYRRVHWNYRKVIKPIVLFSVGFAHSERLRLQNQLSDNRRINFQQFTKLTHYSNWTGVIPFASISAYICRTSTCEIRYKHLNEGRNIIIVIIYFAFLFSLSN